MTENAWSDEERAAIDAWEFGKAKLRRLIYRDHLERMRSYPELAALYVAVHAAMPPRCFATRPICRAGWRR